MLENMRRQGASIFVYLIFCLLIVIFVINFGPQGGNSGGCRGTSNLTVSVNNETPSSAAYHIAYAANEGAGKQKTWVALEMLIRRELLAQEAESRGIDVTIPTLENEIKKGWFFIAGQRMQIPHIFDENGLWNLNAFHSWVGQLNVSKNAYESEQTRSMEAWMMAKILEDSVVVSKDEALSEFLFEGNTATYDVVAFKPETYRSALKITDADVDRFLASHADEVSARYKADERTYKAVKPQIFLRQIFIEKPAPAGSGSGAGSGSAAAKPPAADDGKAKLEAARTQIGTSKDKFIEQAKTLNSDEAARNAAGELGWRTIDNPMLGDKALSDAVKTLKPGEITPVITTDRGSYLLMAEDKREGDLSFDQVKREIAKELARDTWGKEAAKRAALAALDHAKSSPGFTLDQMYEHDKAEAPGGNGIEQMIQQIQNDPNLTPEQKQQRMQQLLQILGNQPGTGESGSLEVESKDIPAGWYADANGAGGSATGSAGEKGSAAPAAGSAAPAAGSAAPAAGSAAGSGAGSAAPAAPPAAEPIKASSDQLPAMSEVAKAHVNRFGPAPRTPSMPGLGQSKEAIAAVFDQLTPGELAPQIYEADGNYILVQEVARAKPDVKDFDKNADERVSQMRDTRAKDFVNGWLKQRCEQLAKEGKIVANQELIAEHDDQGKLLPTQYRPCISFR
jgi:parvulin-like peptidyl-prolyl isomerase